MESKLIAVHFGTGNNTFLPEFTLKRNNLSNSF